MRLAMEQAAKAEAAGDVPIGAVHLSPHRLAGSEGWSGV